MIAERLSPDELDFMELLHYPIAAAECLFSDLEHDNFAEFTEQCSEVRFYQYPMVSGECLLAEDPNLTKKENFKLREGAGTLFVLGARKFGKTLVVEKVDLCLSALLQPGERVGFASLDVMHIRAVLEDFIRGLESHPIFHYFLSPKINRHPNYRIQLRTGWTLESINFNLASKTPGSGFYGKHLTRLYLEEVSFETDEVYKKRIDAVSEFGAVVRGSGMMVFTKHSPTGRFYYDLQNKSKILNLPQYVSPLWDDRENQKALTEYSGEQSIGYRVFVKGELVEDAISVIDMSRVRPLYLENKEVKRFEITKDNFANFEAILVLERYRSALAAYVTADVGETAPTEIAIIFELPSQEFTRYRFVYNVTLHNLTDKEQFLIFKYILEQVQANYVGIDTTDGLGRAIYRRLEEIFPKENLQWCSFNEKLPVDFEKDDKGNVVLDNEGHPVYREEYVLEWAVQHLKRLLYQGRMELPPDHKLDMQLNSLISMQSGNRTIYKCIAEEDHLLQAFEVFSVTQWMNEFKNARPILKKKFSKVGAFTGGQVPPPSSLAV